MGWSAIYVNWKIRCAKKRVGPFHPSWDGFVSRWIQLLQAWLSGPPLPILSTDLQVFYDSLVNFLEFGIRSFLSIVDGSLNPVPVSDRDQVVLKELMAKNRGLFLLDLKKRSEYSSVTTTSGECSDEQETPTVSTPLADADDRLSEIASAIPPVDPEVLTLKHKAFLAQLLMDEVDLGESTHGGSHDHAAFSMQATDGPTGQVPGAKPSPNNMPVSWYNVKDLQQLLWAKAEGIERQTRLDLFKKTWKTSIWSEEDDEEMTLPDLEVPLVYSLHYA